MPIEDILQGVSHPGRNDACTRVTGYFLNKTNNPDITATVVEWWNNIGNRIK